MSSVLLGTLTGVYVGIALMMTIAYWLVPNPITEERDPLWEALIAGTIWPVLVLVVIGEIL